MHSKRVDVVVFSTLTKLTRLTISDYFRFVSLTVKKGFSTIDRDMLGDPLGTPSLAKRNLC